MISIAVTYLIREGHESQAEAYMREMTPLARAEAGCRAFGAFRSTEHARTYLFFETYDDEAALALHRTTPHFERLIKNGLMTIMETRTPARYEPIA